MTTALMPSADVDHSATFAAPAPFVVAQRGCALEALLATHTAWVRLPTTYTEMLRRVNDLTQWSFRDVADVLGTSHTTVGKLANGALPTPRSQDAANRIEPLVDVLGRLSPLIAPGRNLASVLDEPSPDGETARELLAAGEWSRALLTAMDVITGTRPARPQLRPGVRRERPTRELL